MMKKNEFLSCDEIALNHLNARRAFERGFAAFERCVAALNCAKRYNPLAL